MAVEVDRKLLLLAIILLSAGCYAPDLVDCTLTCGADDSCPIGQHCDHGYCSAARSCSPISMPDAADASTRSDASDATASAPTPEMDSPASEPAGDADAAPNPDVSLGRDSGSPSDGSWVDRPTADSGAPCVTENDCPAVPNECSSRVCTNLRCGVSYAKSGTKLAAQTPRDCLSVVCDGNGGTRLNSDPTDVPIDGNPCTQDICTGVAPSNPYELPGTPCQNGMFCNGTGVCGVCIPGSKQCVGVIPQTCNASGQWESAAACTGAAPTCVAGKCIGPRCAGLPSTCGPNADEDCCAAPLVPGGSFKRNYDGVNFRNDTFPATISSFHLDRFEVTVGRYRAFIDSGKGTQLGPPAQGDGAHDAFTGWDPAWNTGLLADRATFTAKSDTCSPAYSTWNDMVRNGADENMPINCVTWYEAVAFCAWDGGFLPTEAEWNYAAAGGSDQRVYPWSPPLTTPPPTPIMDSTYAVYMNFGAAYDALVGSKSPRGDGKWGHADLAGNVAEHLLDWYVSPFPTMSCNDCVTLTSPNTYHAMRGGSTGDDSALLAVSYRDRDLGPASRLSSFGFRCARP